MERRILVTSVAFMYANTGGKLDEGIKPERSRIWQSNRKQHTRATG